MAYIVGLELKDGGLEVTYDDNTCLFLGSYYGTRDLDGFRRGEEIADGATFTCTHSGTFTRLGDKLINHCDPSAMRAVSARGRTAADREAWWDQEAAHMAQGFKYLEERALQPVSEEEHETYWKAEQERYECENEEKWREERARAAEQRQGSQGAPEASAAD